MRGGSDLIQSFFWVGRSSFLTPPPVSVRRAAFLPTSLTDVAFGFQRDDSIAVAPVMNPRAPTRTHS